MNQHEHVPPPVQTLEASLEARLAALEKRHKEDMENVLATVKSLEDRIEACERRTSALIDTNKVMAQRLLKAARAIGSLIK